MFPVVSNLHGMKNISLAAAEIKPLCRTYTQTMTGHLGLVSVNITLLYKDALQATVTPLLKVTTASCCKL